MKASIFMATYNKNICLSNVLYSISRQKVTFPYEVCIVDDCSDEDPEKIIKRFIPTVKYKRLDKNLTFNVITTYLSSMVSPSVDIVIMCSADVVWTQDNVLQILCDSVGPKRTAMAEVRNADVDPKLYKGNFKQFVAKTTRKWTKKKLGRMRGPERAKYRCSPQKGQWYFFLGAVRKEDLFSLDIEKPWCDGVLKDMMIKAGFTYCFPKGVFGIHQNHEKVFYMCSRVTICKKKCVRKKQMLERIRGGSKL